MDRQHRRDLKHDKFVDEIGALSSRAQQNQRLLMTIGAAAVLIALIAYGIYFYKSNQERKAQLALAEGIETIESPLIQPDAPQPIPGAKFKTEPERTAAAEKQFLEVAGKYKNTDAGDVANLYLARIAASKRDVGGARKLLQEFIAEHPNHLLVGGARYSLYQIRVDNGEAAQVTAEINAELAKAEPSLPADSLLVLLAHAYEVQGDETKSRDTYRRIVTEFPDSPFAFEAQRRIGASA
jgi:TolA-binding protein